MTEFDEKSINNLQILKIKLSPTDDKLSSNVTIDKTDVNISIDSNAFTLHSILYKDSINSTSGHYITVIKFGDNFYAFDDDNKVEIFDIFTSSNFPYILIYKKTNTVPVAASLTSLSPPASPPIPISSNLAFHCASSPSANKPTASPIDLEYEQFSNSPDIYPSHISSQLDLDQFYPPSFSF